MRFLWQRNTAIFWTHPVSPHVILKEKAHIDDGGQPVVALYKRLKQGRCLRIERGKM